MTADEIRQLENRCIAERLSSPVFDDPDILAFMASLIQDHNHLREKLMTEPDKRKRREKLDMMRCHLKFRAVSCDTYEIAEMARACGAQPIYQEQEEMEKKRLVMPPSVLHEVRG